MGSVHSSKPSALRPALFLGSRPTLAARSSPPQKRYSVVVAAQQTSEKPDVAKFADSIGLPTDEGLFGFKPFPEVWVGRLAMMGFLCSCIGEFLTGRGTLQQIGLLTPNPLLLSGILLVTGGATVAATFNTIAKAQTGNLSKTDLKRYQNFFGIKDNEEAERVAKAMKDRGDFTSPDRLDLIAENRAAGTPADKFLSLDDRGEADAEAAKRKAQASILTIDDRSEADAEADAMKQREQGKAGTSVSMAARADVVEQSNFQNAEWNYARQVELTNGRWAMIGFWACIIVEAATGRGILQQCILYLKLSGLLGAASGF
ncbi:hypothetical protein WJX72_001684 [[Myrmecia] bisecta]|uniref:Uncharacterized protein n=1 Tax=[Myrmecia] bisecta TaxID=41462 RepID=A0AAW1P9G7_9CHLO